MVKHWGLCLALILAVPVNAQGWLERVEMPTRSALNERPIMFYLPEDYAKDDTTCYPVVYLLHGINGDETSWENDGNIQAKMDSLIANHIIRPCIVVMPNTNSGKYIWVKQDRSLLQNLFNYFGNRKGNFMTYFSEIEQTADSLFRISPNPQDHAIAGLSNGAFQAATIANMMPGQFAWVGLFSPVIFKEQVPTVDEEWCMSSSLPHGTRYWIGVGKGDFFHSSGINFCKRLYKAHIPCVLVDDNGGHDWRSWQSYFVQFIYSAFPYQ